MAESGMILVGVNHKVAPVEVRERLAFGAERIPGALEKLSAALAQSGDPVELVLLSTCNRSEVYLYAQEAACVELETLQAKILDFLAGYAAMDRQALQQITYTYTNRAVTRHLLRVAAGLDSLVLGENEILGQVKQAAALAHTGGSSGAVLAALFRMAAQAGKRVRSETELGRSSLSVASVAAELAEQTFGSLEQRTALLIGAGKISSITGRALVRAGLRCILVANRTFERAQRLAHSLGGASKAQAVHFDSLVEYLESADIVICSTGAPHIVLHKCSVVEAVRHRDGRPLLIADLAVPRDVDPSIAGLPGVTLVDIDDLGELAEARHPTALAARQQAEAIVTQAELEFCTWLGTRCCAPLIRALKDKAQTICQIELQRTLPRLGDLDPGQQAAVEAMAQAIANRLLHDPIMHLKDTSLAEPGAEIYQEWFEGLFDLKAVG